MRPELHKSEPARPYRPYNVREEKIEPLLFYLKKRLQPVCGTCRTDPFALKKLIEKMLNGRIGIGNQYVPYHQAPPRANQIALKSL